MQEIRPDKYIARAGKKGDKAEDLRKAVTYLNREIEKRKKENIGTVGRPDAFEAAVKDCERESDYEAGRQENL